MWRLENARQRNFISCSFRVFAIIFHFSMFLSFSIFRCVCIFLCVFKCFQWDTTGATGRMSSSRTRIVNTPNLCQHMHLFPYVNPHVSMSMCPCVCMSVCLYVNMSIICLFVSICPNVHNMSMCLYVCMSTSISLFSSFVVVFTCCG